jgi:hypothetical protein
MFSKCKGGECWVRAVEWVRHLDVIYGQVDAQVRLGGVGDLVPAKSVEVFLEGRFKEEAMGVLPGKEESSAVEFIKHYNFSNRHFSK